MAIRHYLLFMVLVAGTKADEVTWYRTFSNEQIAPAYVTGYQTLKNKIINPLLAYSHQASVGQNETAVSEIVSLVQELTCATKELYNSLSTALNASEQLNVAVDSKLLELISLISQKENVVREAYDSIRSIEAQLTDAQRMVTDAENELKNKGNELFQADADLANKQRKLDEARHCGMRRKKRLFGSIFKPIFKPFESIVKPIIKPVCSVVNHGGIQNAKKRRGDAEGAVNAARDVLNNRQQILGGLRSLSDSFQNQRAQAESQLKTLSAELAQFQNRQIALANMTRELRNVIQHLATFVSKSSVLYDELQELVSFELLIEPLNAILTELSENGLTFEASTGVTQISSTEIETIQKTIELVKAALPSLPLNEEESYIC